MANKRILVGGSFAPPLDNDGLDRYEQLAKACDDRKCQGYMLDLVNMLRVFWETGESKAEEQAAPLGHAIKPLEDAEIERIWHFVPWPEECDVIGAAFESIPAGETRNAAHHLLWYARELAQDREPTTKDRVKLG